MWDDQFESLLRPFLPFLETDEKLEPDLDLREVGLDSLGIVDLLVALELAYQVRLVDEALTLETFATPAVLWKTLNEMQDTAA